MGGKGLREIIILLLCIDEEGVWNQKCVWHHKIFGTPCTPYSQPPHLQKVIYIPADQNPYLVYQNLTSILT